MLIGCNKGPGFIVLGPGCPTGSLWVSCRSQGVKQQLPGSHSGLPIPRPASTACLCPRGPGEDGSAQHRGSPWLKSSSSPTPRNPWILGGMSWYSTVMRGAAWYSMEGGYPQLGASYAPCRYVPRGLLVPSHSEVGEPCARHFNFTCPSKTRLHLSICGIIAHRYSGEMHTAQRGNRWWCVASQLFTHG